MQTIRLESPTVGPGKTVPREHTSQGANTSPALSWFGLPSDTKEIAVALEDLDNHMFPREKVLVQWLVYGIPATASGLPASVPRGANISMPADIAGAHQALTHYDVQGYRGPEPPAGEPHHYRFVVYALNATLGIGPNRTAESVMDHIAGHIIAEGEIKATYARTP